MHKLNLANLQRSESEMTRFSIEIVLIFSRVFHCQLIANNECSSSTYCNCFAPGSLFNCDQVNCAHYKGQGRRQSTSVQYSTVHCRVVYYTVHYTVQVSRPFKGIPKLKTNFLPQNHLINIRLVVFAEFFVDQFFTHF